MVIIFRLSGVVDFILVDSRVTSHESRPFNRRFIPYDSVESMNGSVIIMRRNTAQYKHKPDKSSRSSVLQFLQPKT